jgi:hypothetical protein
MIEIQLTDVNDFLPIASGHKEVCLVLQGPVNLNERDEFLYALKERYKVITGQPAGHFIPRTHMLTNSEREHRLNPVSVNNAHHMVLESFAHTLVNPRLKNNLLIIDGVGKSAIQMSPYVSLSKAFRYHVLIVLFRRREDKFDPCSIPDSWDRVTLYPEDLRRFISQLNTNTELTY